MTTATGLASGQSPIDVTDWVASQEAAPRIAYGSDANRVERVHGLPIIHFNRGSELSLGHDRFRLLQLHWHTPAEHTIAAAEFDAELHFVHIGQHDELLVVGVVYRLGDSDEGLQRIIDQTLAAAEEDGAVPSLSAADHAPQSDGFYHYTGSLTAAPFSEPVQWYLARTTGTLSHRQFDQLQSLTGGPNARPLQDRNERTILCVGCAC